MRYRLLIVLSMIFMLFTGCTFNDQQVYMSPGSGRDNLFRIDDLHCSVKEAKVYLANYKNLYGTVADKSLWSSEFDTPRMEDSVKDAILYHLSRVYAMNVYAKDQEETLSEEEEQLIIDAAKEYYSSLNQDEIDYMEVKEEDIAEMYRRYVLAEKVFFGLMNTVDEEVSEDEARVMDAYVIYMTDLDKASELSSQVAEAGEGFEDLVNMYSEGPKNMQSFSRGTYSDEIDAVVFALDNGQVSQMLSDDSGYYYFQCVNVYNEELSEKNKANVIAERKQALYDSIIEEQTGKYYSYLDEEIWNELSIPRDENIVTDSFFEVIDKYISYAG